MFVLDSHCDTPTMMVDGLDIGLDNPEAQIDLPKLKAGGVDASFFALYTPIDIPENESTGYAVKMLASIYDALDKYKDKVALALSPDEALANKKKNLFSILIGMENGLPIGSSLSLLRLFYRFGVRYMTLAHNADNQIADSAMEGKRWGGLSPFGREVVAEMNRLGMIVDVAHISDATFFDVLSVSKAPVLSTHSCCRALADHPRNMTDDMIRQMADKGGVIQINFYPVFLSEKFASAYSENPETAGELMPTIEDVFAHIDHAVKVAGVEHVGIGTDFDGIEVTPVGLENVSKLPALFDLMSRKGYTDDQIELIAGKNFTRVFREVISLSSNH